MAASVELLKAARAKIADPANWIVGTWAVDARGYCTSARGSDAACWCARGALLAAAPTHDWPMHEELALGIAAREEFGLNIVGVNDRLGHAAVLQIYDRAIAKAEASNA